MIPDFTTTANLMFYFLPDGIDFTSSGTILHHSCGQGGLSRRDGSVWPFEMLPKKPCDPSLYHFLKKKRYIPISRIKNVCLLKLEVHEVFKGWDSKWWCMHKYGYYTSVRDAALSGLRYDVILLVAPREGVTVSAAYTTRCVVCMLLPLNAHN